MAREMRDEEKRTMAYGESIYRTWPQGAPPSVIGRGGMGTAQEEVDLARSKGRKIGRGIQVPGGGYIFTTTPGAPPAGPAPEAGAVPAGTPPGGSIVDQVLGENMREVKFTRNPKTGEVEERSIRIHTPTNLPGSTGPMLQGGPTGQQPSNIIPPQVAGIPATNLAEAMQPPGPVIAPTIRPVQGALPAVPGSVEERETERIRAEMLPQIAAVTGGVPAGQPPAPGPGTVAGAQGYNLPMRKISEMALQPPPGAGVGPIAGAPPAVQAPRTEAQPATRTEPVQPETAAPDEEALPPGAPKSAEEAARLGPGMYKTFLEASGSASASPAQRDRSKAVLAQMDQERYLEQERRTRTGIAKTQAEAMTAKALGPAQIKAEAGKAVGEAKLAWEKEAFGAKAKQTSELEKQKHLQRIDEINRRSENYKDYQQQKFENEKEIKQLQNELKKNSNYSVTINGTDYVRVGNTLVNKETQEAVFFDDTAALMSYMQKEKGTAPATSARAESAAAPAATGGAPREGATASNKRTGEKLVYRNGQWQRA
ncbi:MAG: hypothetical protein WC453_05035 [Patescibacteria group bacterium]